MTLQKGSFEHWLSSMNPNNKTVMTNEMVVLYLNLNSYGEKLTQDNPLE